MVATSVTQVTTKIGSHKLPDGSEIVLYSFGLIEWSAIQEAALSHYKRSVIKTYTDTLDLLPPEMRQEELRRVYKEVQSLAVGDAPRRVMKMPKLDADGNEVFEGGRIVLEDQEVDYVSWWMSETLDGKLHCLWLSARKAPGQERWTKEDISRLFEQSMTEQLAALEIEQAAQTVGRLSRSELAGNSPSPPP